jgi:molecular chaperone GrpE (heat shock protein)
VLVDESPDGEESPSGAFHLLLPSNELLEGPGEGGSFDDFGETAADPEIEEVLADFRAWLQNAQEEAIPPDEAEPETIDLSTVLGHFVGLRQEVNLQTRSVRAQQEQSGEALRQLQQALDALMRSQARNEQLSAKEEEERQRPLLKTLTDLYDSLALASREIQRAEQGMEKLVETMKDCESIDDGPIPQRQEIALPQSRSFWSRWLLSPPAEAALRSSQEETQRAIDRLCEERRARQERVEQSRKASESVREALTSIVTGYTMSLQRIERALRQHGLEAIPTVGEAFDPDLMEAVARAPGTDRPAGEVVAEVRRGYLWKGRLFRYAQVSVAI